MNEVDAIKNKKHIEKMKKALEGNKRDLLLFIMGINVGLRISDLIKLTVGNVLEHKLVIKEDKTGKTRTIEINRSTREAIDDYLSTRDYEEDEYLFKSRKGENKSIGRVEAWQILNDAADRAKLDINIGTHTLRKTFGYWAYKQGIDITLLQQIFNHSTPKITLRYIGITQDDVKDVYMNLNL